MKFAISTPPGDAAVLARIMPVMRAAFDPEFGEAWTVAQCASALAIPGTWLTIAEIAGEIAGFALARRVLDETELLLLAVDPIRRRYGIGRALVERVDADAIRAGGASLFLEVRVNNGARQFYGNLGFVQIGARRNYYRGVSGLYSDAVTLRRCNN